MSNSIFKPNVMLITVDQVKEMGYVHKNVLPDTIKTTIKRVQIGMLRKLMGRWAYEALITDVSNSLAPTDPLVPLSDDKITLIEEYIHPYLTACVDYRIIYPLTLRSRSKSVGKGTDDNHVPADVTELIKLKDQMLSDVSNYAELLQQQLYFIPGYTYACLGSCYDPLFGCSHYQLQDVNDSRFKTPTKTPGNAIKFR